MIIPRYLLSYRTIPHTETGKTPSELLFNRNINTRLNFVKPHVSQIMNEEGKRFTDFVNNSKTLCSFYVGDNVWIRYYGQNTPKWVEGKIAKKIGRVMYETKIDVTNCVLRKHIDQLRYHRCVDDIAHSQDKPLSSQENTVADPPRIAEQSQHLPSPEYLSN